MKRSFGSLEVEIVRGDIASQPDMDTVVNAANAELMPGGGVAGAIHRAAGPGLAEECRPLAPISPGEAVITGAHGLPNEHVIHVLGPVYGRDEPSGELLADCYKNAIRLADENGLSSVAFPAISTGAFGYPGEEAAGVAMKAVTGEAAGVSNLRKVRFVLFSDREREVHEEALSGVR
ncbi:MAG: macro domain-containing protein [Actinomycetota bacterium]|nr:macro domain-containing protein [Rubrobacter sp.]MDQ3506946.1 macro domain-containing protein [Actinomycetota bacterium]